MDKMLVIKGKNTMDTAQRTDVLRYLQDNASTEELIKIKKLAQDPQMRAMLNNL